MFGIGWKIQLSIALALVAGMITLGLLYRAELKHSGELEHSLARTRADLADTEKQLRAVEAQRANAAKVVAQYKKIVDGVRKESRELRDEVESLERKNEEIKDWGYNDMPDGVFNMLLQDSDPD